MAVPITSNVTVGKSTSVTSSVTPTTQLVKPNFIITSPKMGDIWYVGDIVTVTWTSINIPESATVTVRLIDASGNGFEEILGKTKNTGSFTWKVTSTAVGNRRELSLFTPEGVDNEYGFSFTILGSRQYSSRLLRIRFR